MKSSPIQSRGFTLLEILLTISILGTVTILVYSFALFMNDMFETSSEQSEIQGRMRLIDEVLREKIRNATEMTLKKEDTDKHAHSFKLEAEGDGGVYYLTYNGRRIAECIDVEVTIASESSSAILEARMTVNDASVLSSRIILNNLKPDEVDIRSGTYFSLKEYVLYFDKPQ